MTRAWMAGLVVVALAAGCKKPVDTAPIAAEAAGLQQHENELLGKRGDLQRERTKISEARKELVERRGQLGHDSVGQAALDDEEKKLTAKESDLTTQEAAVDKKFEELLRSRAELVQKVTAAVQGAPGADPGEHTARREQSVAERERTFAKRETDIAAREASIAEREKTLAKREKDTCGAGTQVVIAAPKVEPPKGGKYSAHDVEPVYKKALKVMQERGILASDLPPGTGKLIEETRDALKASDYVRAKYSADQLLATVEQIKVDRNFIAAKIARLSATMRGKKLDGEPRKNVETLFADVTSNYGDGRFQDANTKINKLYSALK